MPQFYAHDMSSILGEVERLGFPDSKPNLEESLLPDWYLKDKKFCVMRIAQGLGDWGIISAMPRLLKEKYPDCKVYVPGKEVIGVIFRNMLKSFKHWPNPEENSELIFKNNPYVDGFIRSRKELIEKASGGIFHDHFRVYNEDTDTPLVEQMLKFWRLEDREVINSLPELYWSDEEIKKCDKFIKVHFGNEPYGGFIDSNTDIKIKDFESNEARKKVGHWKLEQELAEHQKHYGGWRDEVVIKLLKENSNLRYVYYGDIEDSPFKDYIDIAVNFKEEK